jgi:hypothetical protein
MPRNDPFLKTSTGISILPYLSPFTKCQFSGTHFYIVADLIENLVCMYIAALEEAYWKKGNLFFQLTSCFM